jgi:hypothetical protein
MAIPAPGLELEMPIAAPPERVRFDARAPALQ